MKHIIPHKLMIEFNQDTTFKSAILIYRVRLDSGEEGQQYHSLEIDRKKFNILTMNGFLNTAMVHTKDTENKRAVSEQPINL